MIVAVTGTRMGITTAQIAAITRHLRHATWLHHGGAVGADRTCHAIFARPWQTQVWPSNAEQERWAREQPIGVIHARRLPLNRNRAMVNIVERVFALPAGMEEEQRSGTWATVRYARAVKCPCLVIYPNGSETLQIY